MIAEPDAAAPPVPRWHIHRRLYDWVLHWADTPYGPWALGLLSFAESSFFPVPPDPLLLALAIGKPKRALRFALICSAASVLGGVFGYMIGWLLTDVGRAIVDFLISSHLCPAQVEVNGVLVSVWEYVRMRFDQNVFLAVFFAGLTPIPYKIFTIAGGAFQVNLGLFIGASIFSRSLRFFAEGLLVYRFGPSIKHFIDKYFNILCLVFMVLLIGGFMVIKYI